MNQSKKNENNKVKRFFLTFIDVIITWLPIIIIIICCTVSLFPWPDNIEAPLNINSSVLISFIAYAISIAKNNYDITIKLQKKIDNLKQTNADDFFIKRIELEPLNEIFSRAKKLSFSGGHLSTITQHESLINFLKDGNQARFLLPNPLNSFIVDQYAQNFMVKTTPALLKHQIITSLTTLYSLMESDYNIEVKVYNKMPSFGLQIIEPLTKTPKMIFVELHTMQTNLNERISFKVEEIESNETFEYFQNQFEILWDNSNLLKSVPELIALIKEIDLQEKEKD